MLLPPAPGATGTIHDPWPEHRESALFLRQPMFRSVSGTHRSQIGRLPLIQSQMTLRAAMFLSGYLMIRDCVRLKQHKRSVCSTRPTTIRTNHHREYVCAHNTRICVRHVLLRRKQGSRVVHVTDVQLVIRRIQVDLPQPVHCFKCRELK